MSGSGDFDFDQGSGVRKGGTVKIRARSILKNVGFGTNSKFILNLSQKNNQKEMILES